MEALDIAEPIIKRYVRRLLRNFTREDRLDAAQSIRLRLLEKIIPAYNPSRGPLEPFLYRAIQNCVKDERRRLRALRKHDSGVAWSDDLVSTVDTAGAEDIASILMTEPATYLSPKFCELLETLTASASASECASKLNVTGPVLSRRVYRLRQHVRKLIAA